MGQDVSKELSTVLVSELEIFALEEIAVALNIRQDYYQVETSIVLNETINTSEMVSRFSGIPVPKTRLWLVVMPFLTNLVFTKMESLKILLPMKSSLLNWSVSRVTASHLENCQVAMPLLKN